MDAYVVDTNVLIAANGRETHASVECQLSCVEQLMQIVSKPDKVCIDSLDLIMAEYRRYASYAGAPGVGDMFFRHVHDNIGNVTLCEQVGIHPGGGSFLEYPTDPNLAGFDLSDHKFVAVCRASAYKPTIVNATDSDWKIFRQPLAKNRIRVRNLSRC